MKRIMLIVTIFSLSVFAAENDSNDTKSLAQKQLAEAMELEKKYAREQTFYNADNYDFKGSEVNKDSLKNIPIIEIDDPSLDSQTMLGME